MTGFGKQLVESTHPPWAEHYLRYKLLKKIIKLIKVAEEQGFVAITTVREKLKADGPSSSPGLLADERQRLEGQAHGLEGLSRIQLEAFYEELIGIEHARFKAFSKSQWQAMVDAEAAAGAAAGSADTPGAVRARMAVRRISLEDRRLLLSFQDIQYVAFFKIVKKFDKVTGRALLPAIMEKLDTEIANGEFSGEGMVATADAGAAADLDLDLSRARNQSVEQIKHANQLSKSALLVQAPLLTSGEKQERLQAADLVESGGLEKLTLLDDGVEPLNMLSFTEHVTRVKAEVFSGFIAEVIDGVKISDPETAAALEKLQRAHQTLFRVNNRSKGPLLIPPGTPTRREGSREVYIPTGSDKGSSSYGGDTPGGAEDHSQQAISCKESVIGFTRQFLPASVLWLPEYKCAEQLKADLVAGATLAIMGVPQGLAYASLVGIAPVYGIYTVIFPPIVYGFLGHSRQGAVGPMSIPCLIIAAVVDKHAGLEGSMEDRVALTMALTCMIGFVCFIAGFLRLGLLINFISNNVLTGFVHASAFMVCASMAPKLLGVSIEKSSVIYETLPRTLEVLPDMKAGSLVLSVCGILLLLALNAGKSQAKRRVTEAKQALVKTLSKSPRSPKGSELDAPATVSECCRGLNILFTVFSPVMIFVVAMVAAGGFMCEWRHFESAGSAGGEEEEHVTPVCFEVKMVGDLPFGWPGVNLPWDRLGADLLWDACSVSMVILAEHVSNVKLYSAMHNYEVDHNAELMSIGITNCIGSLFSSFAVGARFSGSAVNNSVGATSQVSLLASGVVALALMPALAPLLYFLPKPALSIVVMFAVAGVVDVHAWPRLWRVSRHDFFVMACSFGATLALGVLSGLGAAIAVSLAIFILNSSQPRVVELGRATGSVDYRPLEVSDTTLRRVPGAKLLRLESSLAFFNVSALTTRIASELHNLLSLENLDKSSIWHAMVLDFSCTPWVDSTAATAFLDAVKSVQDFHGYPIVLCNCNNACVEVLRSSGIEGIIPPKHMFYSVHDAARAIALGRVTLGGEDQEDEEEAGGLVEVKVDARP